MDHVVTNNINTSIDQLNDAIKNGPTFDTNRFNFGSSPSRLRIRDNRPQLFRAFPRLPTTASYSSYPVVNTLPRYQNEKIFCIGSPYASKACSNLSLVSNSASPRLFRSAPLRSPGTLGRGRVPAIQGPPGEQHVASGAPGGKGGLPPPK